MCVQQDAQPKVIVDDLEVDVIAPLLVPSIIVRPFGIGDCKVSDCYRVLKDGDN